MKRDRMHWIFFVRKPEKDDLYLAIATVVIVVLYRLVVPSIREGCLFNPECQFIGWEKIRNIVIGEIWQNIGLGLVITLVWYTTKTYLKLWRDKEFLKQLKSSVDRVLSVVENNSAKGFDNQERNRNMFYLTEIINNQINIGVFQPDNLLIEQVDKCNSILSITESPIALWLDPTYLFFLMVQAINNVTKNVPTEDISYTVPAKKQFLERSQNNAFFMDTLGLIESFINMDDTQKNKGEEIAKVIGKKDVRIYFIKVNDIAQNKGLLEWFIAVHDFAGIHLLLIDKQVLENVEIKQYYKKMQQEMQLNDDESLDVAFRFYDDGLWYARRNYNQLHDVNLGSEEQFTGDLLLFLKKITSCLNTCEKKCLLFPNKDGRFNQSEDNGLGNIILNEDKTRLIIKK